MTGDGVSDDYIPDGFKSISNSIAQCALQMLEIEATLDMHGFLTSKSKVKSSPPSDLITGNGLTPNIWNVLLVDKRAEVLRAKRNAFLVSHIRTDAEGNPIQIKDPPNNVLVLDKSYIARDYLPSPESKHNIDNIVSQFTLNTEQERAFRIIANHASTTIKDPLNMYIGGMGGTSKSQVIKALSAFFDVENKSYVFLVCAPTDSAAALVGGSTYHSLLCFRGGGDAKHASKDINTSQKSLDGIRERLEHAEYIFIDEISMVNCNALFDISSQMNLALRVDDKAFAGKSMIFSGDFAQLPPVASSSFMLYSRDVSSIVHTTNAVN